MPLSFSSKTILNYLAVATIFGEGFIFPAKQLLGTRFDMRLTYFIIAAFFLITVSFFKKLYFNKIFLYVFALLSFFSLINVVLGNVNINDSLKQVFAIFFNALFFYTVIKFNGNDIKKLFIIYIRIALVVAIIGLLQEIGCFLKIECLYDFKAWIPNWSFSRRFVGKLLSINSIMPEPSSFCIALFPAVIVSILSITHKHLKLVSITDAIIIIAAFLLSFSSLGYLGLFFLGIALSLQYMNSRKLVIVISFLFFLPLLLYRSVPFFQVRLKDSIRVMNGQEKLGDANLSTFTLFNNAVITRRVLSDNFLFGHGLGSHEHSFDIYNTYEYRTNRPILNKRDANSLILRLLSETGLIGAGTVLIFLFRCFIRSRRDERDYFWAINISIFVFLILRLIRYGNYFSEGFFFFFWVYFFTKVRQSKCGRGIQGSQIAPHEHPY